MARKLVVRPEVAAHQAYLEGVAKNLADKLTARMDHPAAPSSSISKNSRCNWAA